MGNEQTCWEILGIDKTYDTKLIKRAYATQAALVHPEEDATKFIILRRAYEQAMAISRAMNSIQNDYDENSYVLESNITKYLNTSTVDGEIRSSKFNFDSFEEIKDQNLQTKLNLFYIDAFFKSIKVKRKVSISTICNQPEFSDILSDRDATIYLLNNIYSYLRSINATNSEQAEQVMRTISNFWYYDVEIDDKIFGIIKEFPKEHVYINKYIKIFITAVVSLLIAVFSLIGSSLIPEKQHKLKNEFELSYSVKQNVFNVQFPYDHGIESFNFIFEDYETVNVQFSNVVGDEITTDIETFKRNNNERIIYEPDKWVVGVYADFKYMSGRSGRYFILSVGQSEVLYTVVSKEEFDEIVENPLKYNEIETLMSKTTPRYK
ncbi:J domain-containing protein [Erysipelothrix inopinata]|uniref:J domain-containing protein n=1 Tax=Erysipelothrix inopinata TaxID=225084 RepID=A0A7G9S1G7_9FIRM|nr:J domain-containing protein [Erysipelothrix inopinata]QNN61692.1 J domain-containing protein [Erysipelothrix inopinata]